MARLANSRIGALRVSGAPVMNAPGVSVDPAADMAPVDVTLTVTVDDSDGFDTTAVEVYDGTERLGPAEDQGGGEWSFSGSLAAGHHNLRARRTTAEGIVFSKSLRVFSADIGDVQITESLALVPAVDGGKLELRNGTTVLARVTLSDPAFDEAAGVYTAIGGDGETAISGENPLTLDVIASGIVDNYRVLNSANALQWSGEVGGPDSGAALIMNDREVFTGMDAFVTAWTHDTNA